MKTKVFLTAPTSGSEQYYEEMETFLKEYHPFNWTFDILRYCWIFEVRHEDTDELCGYYWLSYAQVVPEHILEFHACFAPKFQKRVWTKKLILTVADNIVEESGCMKYMAQCHTDNLRKLWHFMGWEVGHLFATYTVPEKPDGRHIEDCGPSEDHAAG